MTRSFQRSLASQRKIDDEYAEAGILVNTDSQVPIDESAPCYKSSEEVLKAVLDAGLAEVSVQALASLIVEKALRKGRVGESGSREDLRVHQANILRDGSAGIFPAYGTKHA